MKENNSSRMSLATQHNADYNPLFKKQVLGKCGDVTPD
jgi:hypothetical protein